MAIYNKKMLKTLSAIALATFFASPSNAWFGGDDAPKTRVNSQGQTVPAVKESWLTRKTTFHKEYQPQYNPVTQRVEVPKVNRTYDGLHQNERSETVKPAWYDRMTTHNEEQKRPWNPYGSFSDKRVPAYMYYDKKQAAAWSRHYTAEDLEAVPYMYGSASLVLRKEQEIPQLPEGTNLDGLKDYEENDARMVGMGDVYIRPAGGYDTIDNRSGQNQLAMARSNNIIIQDPMSEDVSMYNNVLIGNPKKADVQATTKIDKPKMEWRKKLSTQEDVAPRPGDFDYKTKEEKLADLSAQPQAPLQYFNAEEGQEIANAYIAPQTSEKVNEYQVENGDTLSEISDKEKIYGDWTLWPLIYDANRAQVKDPDLIYPGQNLDIPRDYDQYQESDARDRAKNREQPISLYDGR